MKVKLGENTVVLPAGFEKIPDNLKKAQVREYIAEKGLVRKIVKHFATKIEKVVLFNPESDEYLALLECYKKDSKALGNAIQEIIDDDGLPIWTKKTQQPKSRKEHQRVSFMLRPVFTASNRENKLENTLNWGYKSDLFTLHFDDERNLQIVRFWDNDRMPSDISDRRKKVSAQLLEVREEIKERYGDWESMAEIISPIIQEVYNIPME